jgi:HEPN domain-containing protein
MLTVAELTSIARARLKDAKALFSKGRYDGAAYVCGYAVEIALKARIVKTLKWRGFPDDGGKSDGFRGFKIHDLESLVQFTAWEDKTKAKLGADWSVVFQWSPEARYRVPGKIAQSDARQMIESTRRILKALL